jgi:hypothetical protein
MLELQRMVSTELEALVGTGSCEFIEEQELVLIAYQE